MGLTTKQKFALIFTLYVFSFFIILYSIFFLIFNFATSYQIRRDIAIESREIITNNLLLDKNLVFVRDQAGASLREYLIAHNTAAVFLDGKKNILRTYGIFALGDFQKNDGALRLITLSENKQIVEKTEIWQGNEISMSVVPLRNNNNVIGYMILGKSLEDLNHFKGIMNMIIISLGALSLVGSFLVGYFISRRAFSPLNRMIKIIDEIELNKLDSPLSSDGHPKDEVVRLSAQFNKMLIRLKDMAERQQAFIANASHELRTPLTRAISSFDLLSLSDTENKDQARTIRKNLFQIDTILEKLLLLTKLKKDINTVKPYILNTDDLYKTLRENFGKDLEKKNLAFDKDMIAELELTIPFEYLLIVLKNLISNAIKYTDSNKKIALVIKKKDGANLITVKDNGSGMTEDEVSHMFDRFYRGKRTREGYGIGLSLVKQICDLYDVKIQVASEVEKGTSMTLMFPLKS